MATLYIVSGPIGNLKDITLRAIETLKNVDYILCEDTRISSKLLNHYEISKRLVTFTDFNEEAKVNGVLSDLIGGQSVALLSDAGTPLISDPGYKLVCEAISQGIKVESIPGPSAVIAALTISGRPPDKFLFLGFLPKKEGKKKKLLEDVKRFLEFIKFSVIMYESPYRLLKTLESIHEIFGDVEVIVCRELTKMHEELVREKVSSAIDHFANKLLKGELVILF